MQRRAFIKLSTLASLYALLPNRSYASSIDTSRVDFSRSIYQNNSAQTIIVFLYGGASQLNGNVTNIETIENNSQSSYYDYFKNITATEHGCWAEAGGEHIEKMLQDGDLTLYRTCYSAIREQNNNKSHGLCTMQNQKGSFDVSGAGIVNNIANILNANGVIDSHTPMPFVTMEGESNFYADGDKLIPGYLKPVATDKNLSNPYIRSRWSVRHWTYYTKQERSQPNYNQSDDKGGFDPALSKEMDELAQKHNSGVIKEAFSKRATLEKFISNIQKSEVPDLGEDAYDKSDFAKELSAAIRLLDKNPDTKIVTIGGSMGGWDYHSGAIDYLSKSQELFKTLRSGMAHLKALNKDGTINIMVFSEFGRNVNLNAAFGWDHGNLQNLYILGGKNYFNHKGIVGETVVDVTGELNRLWLKPKSDSYWFEPMSIAATLYTIYGIQNPNYLTGGDFAPLNIVAI